MRYPKSMSVYTKIVQPNVETIRYWFKDKLSIYFSIITLKGDLITMFNTKLLVRRSICICTIETSRSPIFSPSNKLTIHIFEKTYPSIK